MAFHERGHGLAKAIPLFDNALRRSSLHEAEVGLDGIQSLLQIRLS